MRVLLLLAATASVLLAQPSSDPMELLAKARGILADRARRLPDYTCVQTVDRQYFVRAHPHKRRPETSCAQIAMEDRLRPRDLALSSTDRLRLDVKVSHGDEIGVWAGAPQFGTASVFDLIGGGAYGTGPRSWRQARPRSGRAASVVPAAIYALRSTSLLFAQGYLPDRVYWSALRGQVLYM